MRYCEQNRIYLVKHYPSFLIRLCRSLMREQGASVTTGSTWPPQGLSPSPLRMSNRTLPLLDMHEIVKCIPTLIGFPWIHLSKQNYYFMVQYQKCSESISCDIRLTPQWLYSKQIETNERREAARGSHRKSFLHGPQRNTSQNRERESPNLSHESQRQPSRSRYKHTAFFATPDVTLFQRGKKERGASLSSQR